MFAPFFYSFLLIVNTEICSVCLAGRENRPERRYDDGRKRQSLKTRWATARPSACTWPIKQIRQRKPIISVIGTLLVSLLDVLTPSYNLTADMRLPNYRATLKGGENGAAEDTIFCPTCSSTYIDLIVNTEHLRRYLKLCRRLSTDQ